MSPRSVQHKGTLRDFQQLCLDQGLELEWPAMVPEMGCAAFDKRVVGALPKGAIPRRKWTDRFILSADSRVL